MKVIDCHMHVSRNPRRWGYTPTEAVEAAHRIGVDVICVSDMDMSLYADYRSIRRINNFTLKVMREFPQEVMGYCFIHPGWAREAQDEITRCIVDGGMIGIKFYYQHLMDEPVMYPVIERCIDLGVPMLMHASKTNSTDVLAQGPRLSNGMHFYNVARRYPEALLIHAHLPGGGEWEWGCKWLRKAPTVHVDTSGSLIDQGMIEHMIRELGAERLLFGSDMFYGRGKGKILSAKMTERQRRMIFGRNMKRILARRKI